MTIGKIQRCKIRDVWNNELEFTRWLGNNIDVLGEKLGKNLTNVELEKSAGNFRVDLRCKDETGNIVVTESQFGKGNHDHLGKLVTYVTKLGAKTAVWIAEEHCPEHDNAIQWLNKT